MSGLCQKSTVPGIPWRLVMIHRFVQGYFCRLTMDWSRLLFALLLLGGSLKAQSLRVVDDRGLPIDGAVAEFRTIGGSGRTLFVQSDRNGGMAIPAEAGLAVIVKISHLAFQTRVDTIFIQKDGPVVLKLNKQARQLDEVAITGNLSATYQSEAIVKTEVITASDFRKRGAVTVNDVLSRELNMRVGMDPALGSALSMQGMGGEHIKILVDGVPVIGRMNGNIDLGQLNLSNVERMEIVRGPQSVLYGSDALGGVINLITRRPAQGTWSARLNSYAESIGQYNLDGASSISNKSTTFEASGGRNFFDGWNPPTSKAVRSFLWNPREQVMGQAALTLKGKSTSVRIQSVLFNEHVFDRSEPVVTPYYAYAIDQVYQTQRNSHLLSLDHDFSPFSKFSAVGSYSLYRYVRNTFRKDMVSMNEQLTSDPADDDTTRFSAFFARSTWTKSHAGKRWELLSGFDLNYETGEGSRIGDVDRTMTDLGVYSSLVYTPVKGLVLRPSMRLIFNSRFEAPPVPGMHIKWDAAPTISIRGSWSRGYRAPSLKELYLLFVDNGLHNIRGNEQLSAERSHNIQLGAEWRKAFGKHVFVIEPTVFYNLVTDKIALLQFEQTSTLYTYRNLDRFSTRGTEFRVRYASGRNTFSYGVSVTGTESTVNGIDLQSSAAWFTEHSFSAEHRLILTGTSFSLFVKHNGTQPVFLTNESGAIRSFDNPSFTLLDASVQQSILGDKLQLSGGAKNLLGVTNIVNSGGSGVHGNLSSGSTPVATGTSFFLKLTWLIR